MFVLGLTGSIGMGKSTTAAFFAEAGVPVYDADAAVHRLYAGEAVAVIEATFPGTTAGSSVDRAKLAARVLDDPAALARLEALVHPLVREKQRQFLAASAAQGAPVALLDIPLLFETGGETATDAVVVVTAPPEMQWERAMQRPGMTAEKLEALLAKQMNDTEKRRRADFVVDTSRGFEDARAQVHEILRAVAKMPPRR
jgi:dephospho-CoA kinase